MSTNAQQTEGPTPAPTLQIAEARAFFKEWLTIPFKAYSVQHLPSGEFPTITSTNAPFINNLTSAETTYTVRDEIIAVDDGSFSVRCIVPVGDDEHETFPVLVYIHGGGTLGIGIESLLSER